jgi:hypothetical protein
LFLPTLSPFLPSPFSSSDQSNTDPALSSTLRSIASSELERLTHLKAQVAEHEQLMVALQEAIELADKQAADRCDP